MQITRLLFVETGTYNDMAIRPYQTHVAIDTQNELTEATHGGQNLAASTLAGIAGQIVFPSAVALGTVSIANGFDTRRFRFLMEIQHSNRFGDSTVQYLTGYTDHCDTSLQSGRIDPAMRLYVNNTVTMRRVSEMGPMGPRYRLVVSDASQVLSGSYNASFQSLSASAHTMRPQDVFDTIALQTLDHTRVPVHDPRTSFAQGSKKSSRSNTSAPTYLSRLLSGYKMATLKTDTATTTLDGIMAEASGATREGLIASDLALHEFNRNTSFSQGTSVSYGELCMLSPGLDSQGANAPVLVMHNRGVVSQGFQTHQRGQSEVWTGSATETVMATVLTHSVPSIMMDLMLTEVTLTFTNQTLDGRFMCQWQATPHSFTESPGAEPPDLTPYMQQFTHRLETEVLRDLTRNNLIDINVAMHVDILGETEIHIQIGNQPMIRYVTPSFCDNLMTPLLTNDSKTLHSLALDISHIMDVIGMGSSATPHLGPLGGTALRSEF